MEARNVEIMTDGGRLTVESVVDTEHGVVTLYFGNSFTLRINEEAVDLLREILHEASKDLMVARMKANRLDLNLMQCSEV